MVSGPRRFPVWVRRSVLVVCSWVWEARLSLLDLLRAVPGARAPNATFDLSVWRVTSGWPGCLGCSSGCQRVSFDVGKCSAGRRAGHAGAAAKKCSALLAPWGHQPHQWVPHGSEAFPGQHAYSS